MENATKALIMAGSVLLAIILISFGVYVYTGVNKATTAQDEKKAQEQLLAFNKKYEAYNKSIMYGIDLVSLMNMAKEDQGKYENNITIVYNSGGTEHYDIPAVNTTEFNELKRKIFKCDSGTIQYNSSTGRIQYMHFTEIDTTR